MLIIHLFAPTKVKVNCNFPGHTLDLFGVLDEQDPSIFSGAKRLHLFAKQETLLLGKGIAVWIN